MGVLDGRFYSESLRSRACGSIMVRSGACYKCTNCGTTSGCA